MDAALAHFARQSMDDDRIGGDGADGAYDGGAFAGDDEVSYDRMVPVGLSGGDGLPAVATSSEQMTFGGSLLGGAGDSSMYDNGSDLAFSAAPSPLDGDGVSPAFSSPFGDGEFGTSDPNGATFPSFLPDDAPALVGATTSAMSFDGPSLDGLGENGGDGGGLGGGGAMSRQSTKGSVSSLLVNVKLEDNSVPASPVDTPVASSQPSIVSQMVFPPGTAGAGGSGGRRNLGVERGQHFEFVPHANSPSSVTQTKSTEEMLRESAMRMTEEIAQQDFIKPPVRDVRTVSSSSLNISIEPTPLLTVTPPPPDSVDGWSTAPGARPKRTRATCAWRMASSSSSRRAAR